MTRIARIAALVARSLADLLATLRQREDTEHVQALIRIGFGLGISIYLYSTVGARLDIHVVCIGFEVLSVAIFFAILLRPARSALRRGMGAILDLGTTTYLMLTNAEVGAPLYGIYLWVTFGNGFRYGLRSLHASHILSLIGFSTVVAFNPFWHQHSLMAGGFIMLLVAVPYYGAVLLKGVTSAQDKAEQANAAKTRFLSVMSHEIRTPLNGIIGINALLRRTTVTPEQLDLINTLGMSSEVLLSLLDNVLDIAKIEAGKMPIEQVGFDLHRAIDDAMKIAATQAAAKGLHFGAFVDGAVPRFVVGDPHRLRQVLINLLSNATKFTEQGGVHLRIAAVRDRFGTVTVRGEVIDTGVGISREALDQIFQPFVQADQSTTRQFGGTGLGTTIARQLIELMGGRMGADSTLHEGSTFWFEIPLRTRSGTEEYADLSGVRILLMDFPETLAGTTGELLRGWGATADCWPPAQIAEPWHIVAVPPIGNENVNLSELRSILTTSKPQPKLVVFGTPPAPISRSGAVHTPYTAGVNAPWDSRMVNRAIHFAAIDEITSQARAAQWERRHPFEKGDHRPRVLVAEDNATNRKIIAQVLEHGGFDVTLATTGTQAVDALCRAEFDVVILDKFMPGMSGMEVAERYRANRGDAAAPMIMLTAEATAEAMQQCKEAGMQAFLTKPIDPEMLFETISALTGARASFSQGLSALPLEAPAPSILDESILLELDKHAYSPQFLTDIVESFESDMQELIDRLAVSIERNDWSELPDLRHTIEGTARGSGALRIAESVSQLKLLPELSSDDRRAQLTVLKQCFAETLSAMRRLVEGRTSTV